MGLLTPIPQSTISSIENLIDNAVSKNFSAGVYVVRLNGGIDRFDNISNTPIQDAINSAVALSTGLGDYVWCNNWNGSSVGKMEQNIIIKNYINMRFDGGNIFSNSTDNTPLFTDNGVRASIVITGDAILVRYGGAGNNNRCVFKLDHINSFIRSNSYMVIDSTLGSQNAIISNGNIYLGGDNTIVGTIKVTNGIYYITSNRGTTGLDISGNSEFTYKGVCNTITKSGTGFLSYTGTNNILGTIIVNNGAAYFNNVVISETFVQNGGLCSFINTIFDSPDVNYLFSDSGTAKFASCSFNTGDSYNICISSNIPVITVDNCKFIGAGDNSIFALDAIDIVNYNSYATIDKDSNVTLLVDTALTISENVR
jgi:hypothetical protein